jgi:uncharacterized protein YycO
MDTIRVLFTKQKWNPISYLIRWALPRNRINWSKSSHGMIVDGDYIIEASMLHGVRRVPREVALAGKTIVATVDYSVPDAHNGITWAWTQIGAKYDWLAALGLGVDLNRNWRDPSKWYCYELVAATLAEAGKDVFADTGHITETVLLGIKP